MDNFFLALQQSAPGQWLDQSRNVAIAMQVLHILFFTAVLAVVAVLALRVLNRVFRDKPAAELLAGLRGYYRIMLALALLSGFLQSLPRLLAYTNNSPFVAKQLLLLAAIGLQGWLHHRLASGKFDRDAAVPRELGANESLALVSLLFWVLAAGAGRAIGFV